MLEESKMDKKSIHRSSQLQSRASAVDGKKSTELTNKPWPRNNKKREGPGSAPKNEPNRKNVPAQRGRGQVDRRPRARGPPNYSMGGAEIARLGEDEDPEIGSVYTPGSKKQNWNHLLNFMYTPRGGQDRRDPVPRRQGLQRTPQRHSHDLYLRAYCQFVVKEDGDYRVNILDPDVPIKWEQIEEIVVRSTGRTECPICLGAPVAGRTGLCGHVYCWACVMHYAATHDKQPPPCPVCHAPLQVKDMKPTRMVQWESPTEEITMRLVRRLRGSTVVEAAPARGLARDTAAEAVLPLDDINNAPYAKFFAANKQQVHDILKRERKEIEEQILAEIDTTEIVFMEQALELLKLKEESINLQFDVTKIKEEVLDEAPTVYEKLEVNQNRVDWFDVNEEGAACADIVQEQMQQLELADVESSLNPDAPEFNIDELNDNQPEEFPLIDCPEAADEAKDDTGLTDADKQNQAKYFYFYQANDGQQVFLNSLNVRILTAAWGALAAAPALVTGRVLHRETLSLVEQTRKHMPYASHLPLNCSFDMVEIDLKPPYATEAAINSFSEELDRRARQRARQQCSERRRERAARRAAEGPPRPDLSSALLFPAAPRPSPPDQHPPDPSPSPSSAPSSSGLSFAKVNRQRARQQCSERRRAAEGPPRPDLSSALLFPAAPRPSPPDQHPPDPSPSPSSAPSSSGLSFAKVNRQRARQQCSERRRAAEGPPRPDLSSALLFPAAPRPSPPDQHPPDPSPSPSSAPSSSGLSFAKVNRQRARQQCSERRRAAEGPPRPDLSSALLFPAAPRPSPPDQHPPDPSPSPSSAPSSSGLSFAKVNRQRARQQCSERRRAAEGPPRPDLSSALLFPAAPRPSPPDQHPPDPSPSPSSAPSSSGLSFAKVNRQRARQQCSERRRAAEGPPRPDLSSALLFPAAPRPSPPDQHPPDPSPSPSSAPSSSGLSFAKVNRQRARQQCSERRRAAEGPPRPDLSSALLFPAAPRPSPPDQHPPDPSPSPSSAPSSSGLSFAKMAGTGGTWRVRKVSSPPPPLDDEEGSAPRALVLSDAIEAALQSSIASAPSSSGKKNKKSKHKVLFATGMHRAA